jgi:dUTP pyrophosphatase
VTVLNAPGTVDAGYRGEILVNLINHDRVDAAKISRGDRIAQLVVQRVERAEFRVVDELPDSARGAGGHGSTGGHAGLVTARDPSGKTEGASAHPAAVNGR